MQRTLWNTVNLNSNATKKSAKGKVFLKFYACWVNMDLGNIEIEDFEVQAILATVSIFQIVEAIIKGFEDQVAELSYLYRDLSLLKHCEVLEESEAKEIVDRLALIQKLFAEIIDKLEEKRLSLDE